MAGGISINFLSNVRDLLRGTDSTTEALEGVSDSLDDIGVAGPKATAKAASGIDSVGDSLSDLERQSDRTTSGLGSDFDRAGTKVGDLADKGDDVGRSLDESMRGTSTAISGVGDDAASAGSRVDSELTSAAAAGDAGAQRIEMSFQDAFNKVQSESGAAATKVKADSAESSSGLREGLAETKAEAIANFSEVASSFDGTAQGLLDGIQGTLGGLAQSLPLGIGVAVGAVGAIFGALTNKSRASSEAAAENVSSMYDDMLASGKDYLSQDFVEQKIGSIVRNVKELSAAQKDAASAGTDVSVVIRAQAGDQGALNDVIDAARKKQTQAADAIKTAAANGRDADKSMIDQFGSATKLITKYGELADGTSDSAAQARIARDALDGAKRSMDDQGRSADDLRSKLQKGSNSMGDQADKADGLRTHLESLDKTYNPKVKPSVDMTALDTAVNRYSATKVVTLRTNLVTRNGKSIDA